MPAASISLIISPYHVGIHNHRVGSGPHRILAHSIVPKLSRLAPVSSVTEIPRVDEFEGEIGRSFEVLRRTSAAVSAAVAAGAFPIVLSGNCNASVGVAAGLGGNVEEEQEEEEDLGFVYFDAHTDMDTPSSIVNGYFDAMGVSMLAGRSWHALMETVPGHRVRSLDKFVYCGLRDVTDAQRRDVDEAGVEVVWGDASRRVDFAKELASVLDRKQIGPALVHLDLDCLDKSLGRVNEYPSPGGLLESDLLECMSMVPTKVTPTSLTVCSFNANLEGGDSVAEIAVKSICNFVKSLLDTKVLVP